MKATQYDPKRDAFMVREWYTGHGFPDSMVDFLPPRGVVMEHHGRPVAAGWLYVSDCLHSGIVAWPLTDPDAPPLVAAAALVGVVKELKKIACDIGVSIVFSYASDRTLLRIFEKAGFVKGDAGMTNMIFVNGV